MIAFRQNQSSNCSKYLQKGKICIKNNESTYYNLQQFTSKWVIANQQPFNDYFGEMSENDLVQSMRLQELTQLRSAQDLNIEKFETLSFTNLPLDKEISQKRKRQQNKKQKERIEVEKLTGETSC